ncbi:hypothetical protein Naga_103694g1, partial [Nannochloropsis gaditana]
MLLCAFSGQERRLRGGEGGTQEDLWISRRHQIHPSSSPLPPSLPPSLPAPPASWNASGFFWREKTRTALSFLPMPQAPPPLHRAGRSLGPYRGPRRTLSPALALPPPGPSL